MKGATVELTIGERISWYRRRRGLWQRVLAELVGRTEDWLNKVENNRIQLDRLSVINSIAVELDLSLTDLLAESSFIEWSPDTGRRTVPGHDIGAWFTPRTFRRTVATLVTDALPAREASDLLGHSRVSQTTDTYVGRMAVSRRPADVLDALGGPNRDSKGAPDDSGSSE